ncbi:hypothetical protein PYCC9005_000493 [Savitreella phatthalungensis]
MSSSRASTMSGSGPDAVVDAATVAAREPAKGTRPSAFMQVTAFAVTMTPKLIASAMYETAKLRRTAQTDLTVREALIVNTMKNMLTAGGKISVEELQVLAKTKMGPNGPPSRRQWGINHRIDLTSRDEIVAAVSHAMKTLCPAEIPVDGLPTAEFIDVKGEWEAARTFTGSIKYLTAQERFDKMQADLPDKETVLLYFHGGAYYVGTPAVHRALVVRLCKRAGIKSFSVDYRLAPYHQLPAALMDCLGAYEYLLNPPAGALHKAVPASKIVFGGDSAGGGLVASLLQIIKHSGGRWPMPGGAIMISPWVDMTSSYQFVDGVSYEGKGDYLPNLVDPKGQMFRKRKRSIWPSDVSTVQPYCADAHLMHPLASPVRIRDWEGLCPVIVECGVVERLHAEVRKITQQMVTSGVAVSFAEYESMPHVFHLILPDHGSTITSYRRMAAFIQRMTKGGKLPASEGGRSTAGDEIGDGHGSASGNGSGSGSGDGSESLEDEALFAAPLTVRARHGIVKVLEPWEFCLIDQATLLDRMTKAKAFLIGRGPKPAL